MRQGGRYIPLPRMRTDVTPLFNALDKTRRNKLHSLIEEVGQETLLLSDENLIGTASELATGVLYPYARNRVQLFCEEMKDASITLFLTLREPHLFLISMHSEYLRHNDYVSFEQFLASFDVPGFSYRKVFGWLFKLPANVRVKVLPFEINNGGGVITIAQAIVGEACGPGSGIDTSAFPARKSRSAYTTEELDLAAEISRRSDPSMARFFLNALDARSRRFGETQFQPLSADLVSVLSGRYQEDLQQFSELTRR